MLTLSDTRARYPPERDADRVTSGQVTASQTPEGTGPSVDIRRGRREAPAGPATRPQAAASTAEGPVEAPRRSRPCGTRNMRGSNEGGLAPARVYQQLQHQSLPRRPHPK